MSEILKYKIDEARNMLKKSLNSKAFFTKAQVEKFFDLHDFNKEPTKPDHYAYCTKKANFEELIKEFKKDVVVSFFAEASSRLTNFD